MPQTIEAGDDIENSFIQTLRTGESGTLKDLESQRFSQLDLLYSKNLIIEGNKAMGGNFVIKKLDNRLDYTRIASVYLQNMYNKFVVPVWCAAFDDLKQTGYALYPKLTPVKDMLYEVRDRCNEADLNHAVRLCIPPVALGVDALHTPVLNRRITYYHRHICIDSVFVPTTTSVDGEDRKFPVYGEAMLEISKHTRGSHEAAGEGLEQTSSVHDYRINMMYFHHPDPYTSMVANEYRYYKRHDWFSVGVYMLEVLGIALNMELNRKEAADASADKVHYYLKYAGRLKDAIDLRGFSEQNTSETFQRYIAVALKYIRNDELSSEQLMTYKQGEKEYHFEYGLRAETAELLCLFDDVRDLDAAYKSMQEIVNRKVDKEKKIAAKRQKQEHAARRVIPENVDICQACLLRPSAPFKMRAYRRGAYQRKNDTAWNKCDDNCNRFYCAECYMNGERLFCPMQHGTASSLLGHSSSFALILYGEEFEQPGNEDLFEKEATGLFNVLTHRLIIGLHKDNVLVRPVFSRDSQKTAEQCLQEACKEIKKLIHGRQLLGTQRQEVEECTNDTDYCLFIFYTGHGKQPEDDQGPDGAWATKMVNDDDGEGNVDYILADDVIRHIDSICECSNKECSGSRIGIMYLMAHCYPLAPADFPDIAQRGRKNKSTAITTVVPEYDTKEYIHPSNGSDIIHWLCTLLLSMFSHKCRTRNKGLETCLHCKTMTDHIEQNCYSAFIDGKCLKYHKRHMEDDPEYKTVIEVCAKDDVMLARYHPAGIRYRLFPYTSDHEQQDVDFKLLMDYQKITNAVLTKVREQNPKAKRVGLLTNNETEVTKYGLVWADDLQNKLESTHDTSPSQIFFHVITKPVEVALSCTVDGEEFEDVIELFLDEADVFNIQVGENTFSENMNALSTVLPNVLVYIVHHFYHHEGYGERQSEKSNDTDTERPTSYANGSEVQACEFGSSIQVSGTDFDFREKIRNSFATKVYRDSREVELVMMTKEDWRSLERDASQYWARDRRRSLKVDRDLNKQQKIRITWCDIEETPESA